MKPFRHMLLTLATVYFVLLAALFVGQRVAMYPGDASRVALPVGFIPGIEEVELLAKDGARLIAWSIAPKEGKPVLLYFQGNGGNFASGRTQRFRALTADGTGLFAVNYRGYGGSSGSPTEAGLHLDAEAAYEAAAGRFGADRLVAYGESLGTGVAVQLAARQPVKALILEAPYLSTVAVAKRSFPIFPISIMMHDQFRSDHHIGQIKAPLLILHGDRDGIIPYAQGKQLYELANEPKRFVGFSEGRHNDLYARGSLSHIRRFIEGVATNSLRGSEFATVTNDQAS